MGVSPVMGDHLMNRVPWLERVLVRDIAIIDGTNPVFLGLLGAVGRQKKDDFNQGDLSISFSLVSPYGTISQIVFLWSQDDSENGLSNWTTMTVYSGGQSPVGVQKLYSIKQLIFKVVFPGPGMEIQRVRPTLFPLAMTPWHPKNNMTPTTKCCCWLAPSKAFHIAFIELQDTSRNKDQNIPFHQVVC
ncbi:hypothetical protein Q9966_011809 [Columba livia]|nr:hypothetical protein Q9966_011809 [Columba livia]